MLCRVGPQIRKFELLAAHVYMNAVRLLVERLSFSIVYVVLGAVLPPLDDKCC